MLGSHIQSQTDTAGHTLEEPDVRNRHCQFNMAHTFTTHTGLGDFHTAMVADHALDLDAFVQTAAALPVAGRTENAFAEQTAAFRFKGTVVDSFRIFDFAETPGTDHIRRSYIYRNCIKSVGR